MHIGGFRLQVSVIATAVALLVFSGSASADPPTRIARLGYTSGAVSLSPSGEDDWSRAALNRPLTIGDRLWTDARARAEIQLGGAMVRMGAQTSLSVLNLDEGITQLQLTQGTLTLRVRRLDRNQVFEVDTPNLAFTLRQPGLYRIEVAPDGQDTTIVVRKGQGQAHGERASYVIGASQAYRFSGTDLDDYERLAPTRLDEFDRWSDARDRSYDNSASARYVSSDVLGYQDLDANGSWRVEPSYGRVWVPTRVSSDWAPYRDGHWTWVDPWGWTWIDDAPWGFAVSHYGRWAHLQGTWAWVPGPVRTRAYYAPALVAFVGGSNFQLTISSGNVGAVAWFPLAPREIYRPSYQVSRGYFDNLNRSNTVVSTTVINNTYNSYNTTNVTNITNVVYANRQVAGAVVAVPTSVFVQSQPVSRAAVRVNREVLVSAPVATLAPVAPTRVSVQGGGGAGETPPPRVLQRPVVARSEPAAAHAGFAAQQQQLSARPGRPVDEASRRDIKPGAGAPAPMVKVLPAARAALPVAPPPPPPAAPTPPRGRGDEAKARPGEADAARAPASSVAPPPVVSRPTPAAPVTEQRARPEQDNKSEPKGKDQPRGRQDPRSQGVTTPTPMPAPLPAPAPAAVPRPVAPSVAPAPAVAPDRPQRPPSPPELAPKPQVSLPAATPPKAIAPPPPSPPQRPTPLPPPSAQPKVAAPPAAERPTPPPDRPARAAPVPARPAEARPPVVVAPHPPVPAQATPAPSRERANKPRPAASEAKAEDEREAPKRGGGSDGRAPRN